MKKYLLPVIMLAIFETVAITLWLTMDNLFYLFNFSYIGFSIALGIFLFARGHRYARQVTQLLVGLYMLLCLGLACNENMQIEGFWYYLFNGVFEAATIHYAVAKIFGPLLFGRGWCGYACWTAMILDFLPYKVPQQPRKKLGWIRYITFTASLLEEYWGKGIMTEAIRQICMYVFDKSDIIRIYAEPFAYNAASCRVLEKAGFRFEGTLRNNALKNGKVIDMKMYSLLKSEI